MSEERGEQQENNPLRKSEQEELASNLDSSVSLDVVATKYSPKKPTPILPPELESIPRQQEQTRGWLAKTLVKTLIGTVAATFVVILVDKALVAFEKNTENQGLREIITLIWTSETALIGTALGFYFGSQNSDNS